jgi:phosphoglycerol transferase MdoB-like AlkP superfamily enzyme
MGLIYDSVLVGFWMTLIGYFVPTLNWQKTVFILFITMITVIVIVDGVYYNYYESFVSISNIAGLQSFQEGTALEYSIRIPAVVYMILPVFILTIALIIKQHYLDHYTKAFMYTVAVLFILQFGMYVSWYFKEYDTRLDYYQSNEYLYESMYDNGLYSQKYGYYHYHMLDMIRFKPNEADYDKDEEADVFFENNLHEPNDYSDLYSGYNIVTILAESLDTRFIDPVLTPNLYEMSQNGLVFDNYYAPPFQLGATCNSEYMSIVGLSAISTNRWSNNMCDTFIDNAYPYTLAEQLKSIDYDTYYFHGGYEWFYNRQEIIPQYGFETVAFQEDLYAAGYDAYNYHMDTDMMLFVNEYVTFEEPFYMNLLTYSGHGAYDQDIFEIHRDQLESAYPNQSFDSEIENYMLKLVELDKMIEALRDRLELEGVLDNTLFAIYPDHYAYMMTEDIYSSYINTDIDSVELYHQSLILYATNMTGEVNHTVGSTLDLAPTLLNLLDSDLTFNYFTGTDLLSQEPNYVFLPDFSVTDGTNCLELDGTYTGDPALKPLLEQVLEEKIILYEIQEGLLVTDYFKND